MEFKKIQLDKQKLIKIAVGCALAAVATSGLYAYLPLATAGKHHITERDVQTYINASKQFGQITGTETNIGKEDALKTLAVSYAQFDLLSSKGIVIDREKGNTALENTSPLKGLLKKLKTDLGDERYFNTITLPAIIGQPFSAYYNNNDKQSAFAQEILKIGINASSLQAAAEKAGQKIIQISIPNTQETAEFYTIADKNIGGIINKIIDNGGSYLIVQPTTKDERLINAQAIAIPKTLPVAFFKEEIKKANIILKIQPWTLYASNKFFDSQAKEETGKDNTNAAKKQ